MKKSFWERAEDARKLGSFVFVCLAIVTWICTRACFAFFQEAIFYSLKEWLLSPNRFRRVDRASCRNRCVAKRLWPATPGPRASSHAQPQPGSLGSSFPRDAAAEHKKDACEDLPVRQAGPTAARPPAFRITCASPSARPANLAGSSRASMQVKIAKRLAGDMPSRPFARQGS
jgi:hypothetical protein